MSKLINDPILLTKKLISFRSITPDDGGSLEFIASFVDQLGFQTEIFSTHGLKHLFARWSPGVPPGPTKCENVSIFCSKN